MKLIVCDLDETLLDQNKQISKKNLETIYKAQEKGHKFIVATGRGFTYIDHILDELHVLNKEHEYVISNNIMSPTSSTTFSPDAILTRGELNQAMNAINCTEDSVTDTEEVNVKTFAQTIIKSSTEKGFVQLIKSVVFSFKMVKDYSFDMNALVTRGEAAIYFRAFAE